MQSTYVVRDGRVARAGAAALRLAGFRAARAETLTGDALLNVEHTQDQREEVRAIVADIDPTGREVAT